MGWQGLLKRHGLDITKTDLAAELAHELTIDRGVSGFENFTLDRAKNDACSISYYRTALGRKNVELALGR